jgi:hypothetical protein
MFQKGTFLEELNYVHAVHRMDEGDFYMTSEDFLRHAAECEYMAKFSRDVKNKLVWRDMAERWVRCAELAKRQSTAILHNSLRARPHRKISASSVH